MLLPRKVVQCLYGLDAAEAPGAVMVRYKRLEKGTYVKLQPRCGAAAVALQRLDGGRALAADVTAVHSCLQHAACLACGMHAQWLHHTCRPMHVASCCAPPHCCAPEPPPPRPPPQVP